MDTQWIKYEVFEKERPDWPYRNAGSVHAPDAEMALENARDVFGRRPSCHSLWVAPESAIFARTAQELAASDDWRREPPADAPIETYQVLQKQSQQARETYVVHVGQVEARSPEEALAKALESFSGANVFVWWVVPDRAITRSPEDQVESWFGPAHDKRFRQHLSYPVEPIMRQLRSAQEFEDAH